MPISVLYGDADVPITWSPASLASSLTAARASAVIDNDADDAPRFLDVMVTVKFKLTTGTIANDQRVYIYAYGTTGGTKYPDSVTGADAGITLNNPTALRPIGHVDTPTPNISYTSMPMSLAAAFDGLMPSKWGIAVRNYSGVAFTATAGDHEAVYQGLQTESL